VQVPVYNLSGDVVDKIVSQGSRIERNRTEHLEPVAVKPIQSVLRSHPDESLTVLEDGIDRRLRQSILERQVLEANNLTGDSPGGQQ